MSQLDNPKLVALDEQIHNNHNENTHSMIGSFNCKPDMNTRSMQQGKQKIDACTITDQLICKCQCDQILKLKEKAHKSFMQVIQIQNLYKEQIQQLQEQYEEREKTQIKKFAVKQKMMNDKFRELEQEMDKNRQYLEKERQQKICRCKILQNHILELSFESPFIIQNIDEILPNLVEARQYTSHDDSTDTIQYLKQYIPSKNLGDQHLLLNKNLQQFLNQFKLLLEKEQNNSEALHLFQRIQKNLHDVMILVKILLQNSVDGQQKYNKLYKMNIQGQNKYSKLISAFQASQKQTKFMAEHIRRLSQDKIKIDKKCHELEKTNKNLEDNVRSLRQYLQQKGVAFDSYHKKQYDALSSHHIRDFYGDDEDISVSLRSTGKKTEIHKKHSSNSPNQVLMRMSNPPANKNTVNTFKKKSMFLEKRQPN